MRWVVSALMSLIVYVDYIVNPLLIHNAPVIYN